MKQALTMHTLLQENQIFDGTAGVSAVNRAHSFVPAFQDTATGRNYVSRFADGRAAPCHLLEGLPDELVVERSERGAVTRIKNSVVSGFLRGERFYTRAEAAQIVAV